MIRFISRLYSIRIRAWMNGLLVGTGLFVGAFSVASLAQDASMRPPHASEVVGELERASWETVSDDLSLLEVSTALGTRITALRFNLEAYSLAIEQQQKPKGERASRVIERLGAEVVVNGGFFSIGPDEELKPVGMLILDGEARSTAWTRDGGFLALNLEGIPSITLSKEGPPMWAANAIQSKPVLIEPGGKWAMNTNGTDLEARTLFCLLPGKEAALVLVHGGGLTLFEAGWMLRAKKWGGYFGCDSAIALDGGSSTQLSVGGRPDLKISGLSKVQNFVVVKRR
jgi:hypothetical protein